MIKGLITTTGVLAHPLMIVHLYGPKVFARCCWAILTHRDTTFLNLVFGK